MPEDPAIGTADGPTEGPTEGVIAGATAPRPRGLRWIFVGPDGIRAGWSVLLYAVILTAIAALVFGLLHLVAPQLVPGAKPGADPGSPLTVGVLEAAQVVCVVAATAVMALIERRSPWSYGLADRQPAWRFAAGAAWGLIALSVLIVLLVVTGHMVVEGAALRGADIARYAAAWAVAFLMVGLSEELLTRGYLQSTLARGIRFWPAAVVLSLLFGAAHGGNGGEALMGLVSAGTAGLVFCYSLWRSGSLWWAIGFHSSWDWAQSYLYGTPDSGMVVHGHLLVSHPVGPAWLSGGTVGPEGSIFVFLVMAAAVPVIRLTLTGGPGAPEPPAVVVPRSPAL